MKTNKSFTKRLRVTKKGKMVGRSAGGNHFNAKESRKKQLSRKRGKVYVSLMNTKQKARFLSK